MTIQAFTFGAETYNIDLDDLNLTQENLSQRLMEHSAKFQFIASLALRAKVEVERTEDDLEVIEAVADSEIRSQGDKKTEAAIKNMIILHPKVREAKQQLLEARERETQLYAIMQAYIHRKDCKMALAKNLREQLNNSGDMSF